MRRCGVVLTAMLMIGLGTAAGAVAEPDAFPDLDDFHPVDVANYANFSEYPTTSGVQFVTPGGYRCRMAYTGRQNWWTASCWGELPGTTFNQVQAASDPSGNPIKADFADVDLAARDLYGAMENGKAVQKTFGADDYKPLPAGSRISWAPRSVSGDADQVICAVTETTTACRIQAAGQVGGFILDPGGSRTF